MSQPTQPSGAGRPTFGGFFPIFLTAAVMLLVYYTIDFQVRVSPIIRELQPRTGSAPKTAATPTVSFETPAQLPQPPIVDSAASLSTPVASTPADITLEAATPVIEPVSPEPAAAPASEPPSVLSSNSVTVSDTMCATLPVPIGVPQSPPSDPLTIPTASAVLPQEPAPLTEAAPPASDSASATIAPEVGQ
ncbi:MAG TPA: hypothetical protein PLP29_19980 [Candidatus Ozemobacteraceae bacterium]|nr:hypothetical protein [Candidatus Ozemobacteraceae bacterium]